MASFAHAFQLFPLPLRLNAVHAMFANGLLQPQFGFADSVFAFVEGLYGCYAANEQKS